MGQARGVYCRKTPPLCYHARLSPSCQLPARLASAAPLPGLWPGRGCLLACLPGGSLAYLPLHARMGAWARGGEHGGAPACMPITERTERTESTESTADHGEDGEDGEDGERGA